jgi:hypothetical protein
MKSFHTKVKLMGTTAFGEKRFSEYGKQTRQAMYAYRNIDARSWNHYCRGKAALHILCVCVCVCSFSYPACKAHAPYYIVICLLYGSITFISHSISQKAVYHLYVPQYLTKGTISPLFPTVSHKRLYLPNKI